MAVNSPSLLDDGGGGGLLPLGGGGGLSAHPLLDDGGDLLALSLLVKLAMVVRVVRLLLADGGGVGSCRLPSVTACASSPVLDEGGGPLALKRDLAHPLTKTRGEGWQVEEGRMDAEERVCGVESRLLWRRWWRWW